MTSQFENLQFKRGSKSANDALVGPRGSISIDMETQSIRVHDGETPGGAFEIKRGAAINSETLEFTTATENRIAAGGQTIFTLNVVETTNPDLIQIKVNGDTVTNWTVINGNQIEFDTPFEGGEQITFTNVKNLNVLISEALGTEGGTIEQAIRAAIDGAESIGGVDIEDIVTSQQLEDLGESITQINERFNQFIPAEAGIDCGVIE